MVYQGATGLYYFLINVIPFISNSVPYTFGKYILYFACIEYDYFDILFLSSLCAVCIAYPIASRAFIILENSITFLISGLVS